MATAAQQARFRARDLKRTIEVRLSPEAVKRLNSLVVQTGARGMGDALERLLLAEGRGEHPAWLLNEAIRLGRGYLRLSGTDEGTLHDTTGWHYTIRRER